MSATLTAKIANYLSVLGEIVSAQMSVWTFGNPVGIRNNLTGRRLARQARAARAAQGWPEANPHAAVLAENGFVFLGNKYDPALIASLSRQVDALMADPDKSRPAAQAVERGDPDASRYVVDPAKAVPDLRHLIDDRIEALLKSYFGGHFQWTRTAIYRTSHIEDASREVYSNIWHTDRINTSYLQLFVYLSRNVNREETGAFEIHTRKRSARISRSGFLHRRIVLGPARRLLEDPEAITYMEGDAGTAFVVANAYCIHRAGVPAPGWHRDVVLFAFIPATEAFDGEAHPHLLG